MSGWAIAVLTIGAFVFGVMVGAIIWQNGWGDVPADLRGRRSVRLAEVPDAEAD